ncbi:MAG: outer membrane protein assembly factor BamA [Saprospirales bacterium]|nr:outer membrane protein assembly factor BamA [Saprospirales bacterium]|tara:strand:- start:17373 stop:20030 length:2658 start_codon:yes stop_codon:yes gene_type:complete
MISRFRLRWLLVLGWMSLGGIVWAQNDSTESTLEINPWDFSEPKEYVIAGAVLEGSNLNKGVLLNLAEIPVGSSITLPGDDFAMAIKRLWDQRIFAGVSIYIDSVQGDQIFLRLSITERPRLSRFVITGVKKGDAEEIREMLNLGIASVLQEADKNEIRYKISKYYTDKGFYKPIVTMTEQEDTIMANSVLLRIEVDRGRKVRIDEIQIEGNAQMTSRQIKRSMKNTRERVKFELQELLDIPKNKIDSAFGALDVITDFSASRAFKYGDRFVNLNIFKSSKFSPQSYEDDKEILLARYRDKGYLDAKITFDTAVFLPDGNVFIAMQIEEGSQYYFRNITFSGQAKYSDSLLLQILDIKKGSVYSEGLLNERLFQSQNSDDVSSLYMDNGYLFFNVTPIEQRVEGDSIDLLLKVYEGPQATINAVNIYGNTKTNEKVIRRELYIKPGDKFSRTALMRSQRELANLGYFDPEQMEILPRPNPQNGTVDIDLKVVEKPSDQLELSAGWGGRGNGVVGTLGVQFTNFSLRNVFNGKAWSPLPSGDGQNFTVRVQSNGKLFQSYNLSFTEPWLGGRKPNSLSLSFFRQRLNDLDINRAIEGSLVTTGGSVALGTRLRWPDDYFIVQTSLNFQRYQLDNFNTFDFSFTNGQANNINFSTTIARNSIDQPLFPSRGSNISLTLQATLPYSLLFKGRRNIDFSDPTLDDEIRFRWVEFYKGRFDAEFYTPLAGKLVLYTAAKMGFLGTYNKSLGLTPFERYELGGEGFQQTRFLGRDPIGLRGYNVITPSGGAPIFNKFIMEMRYPISLNPSATVYTLAFLEGGNFWNSIQDYQPFNLKRSFGVGLRVFLPMFGLLGFDYGIGFDDDDLDAVTGDNLFQKYGQFRIILGFEPQ